MTTRLLSKKEQQALIELGRRITKIVKEDMNYPSFDAFSLEHYDIIGKATIYQISEGKRDMKLSTYLRLYKALNKKPEELIKGL